MHMYICTFVCLYRIISITLKAFKRLKHVALWGNGDDAAIIRSHMYVCNGMALGRRAIQNRNLALKIPFFCRRFLASPIAYLCAYICINEFFCMFCTMVSLFYLSCFLNFSNCFYFFFLRVCKSVAALASK